MFLNIWICFKLIGYYLFNDKLTYTVLWRHQALVTTQSTGFQPVGLEPFGGCAISDIRHIRYLHYY